MVNKIVYDAGGGGGKKTPTSTTTTATKPVNITPGTGTKPTTTTPKPVTTTSGPGTKPTVGSSGGGNSTQGSSSKPASSTKKEAKANSSAKPPKESKAPAKPLPLEYREDFGQKEKAKTSKADQDFDLLRLKYSDPMAKKLINAYQTRPGIVSSLVSIIPSLDSAGRFLFAKWNLEELTDKSDLELLKWFLLAYQNDIATQEPIPTDSELTERLLPLFALFSQNLPDINSPGTADQAMLSMPNTLAQELLNNPDLDWDSVNRLLAYIEESGDRGAFTALIAISLANMQTDDNFVANFALKTGFQCFANEAGYGGNCATFVSTSLFFAGIPTDPVWNIGSINPWKTGDPYQGSDVFRGAEQLTNYLAGTWFTGIKNDAIVNEGIYRIENIDERFGVQFGSGYLQEQVFEELRPGALLSVIGPWDHVALIVGFGPLQGGSNSQFYPTYQEAVNAFSGDDEPIVIVPYVIDHGGAEPAGYPRPIRFLVERIEDGRTNYGQNTIYDLSYVPISIP